MPTATQIPVEVEERRTLAALAKQDLAYFCEYESSGTWERAKHLEFLCDRLEAIDRGELKRLVVLMPPRHGKLIADSTPVLTTRGWTTHGELSPGDFVFGVDGAPVEVMGVSAPDLATMEVEFTNGEIIKCHPRHEWTLYDHSRGWWITVETQWLFGPTLRSARRTLWSGPRGKRGGRAIFQLPLIKPLQGEGSSLLPLPPYVLGAWLGDGTSKAPRITHAPNERAVIEKIKSYGYKVTSENIHPTTGVVTTGFGGASSAGGPFWNTLKELGVARNKHIPMAYKLASIKQRLELLAGLVDTDGCVDREKGRVRIVNTNPCLVEDIVEVVHSFGWRASVCVKPPVLSTSGIEGKLPVFSIGFQPTMALPTQLVRKQIKRIAKRRRIGLAEVREAAEPEMGRCIEVSAPDGLYLVGKTLISTHNSEVVSRHYPAWYLGRHPDREVILTSYNDTLARDMSRDARRIFRDASQELWPLKLSQESQAVDRWQLSGHSGKFQAAGVGGPITGRGADLLIIDDPEKNLEEAESHVLQKHKIDWYRSTLRTRLSPQGAIVIVATRWAEHDLVGRILDQEKSGGEYWEVIRLPAIAEEDDPLGRKPGEALWPERFPLELLESTHGGMGDRLWLGLYQQQPQGDIEGALWDRDIIDTYRLAEPPKHEIRRIVVGIDPAGSNDPSADEVGIVVAGVGRDRHAYVLEDLTNHYSPKQWAEIAIHAYNHWEADTIVVETNFGGDMAVSNIHAVDKSVPVKAVKASRGKAIRAQPIANLYEQGKVHHIGVLSALESELCGWTPYSRYSPNRLDALVWTLTELIGKAHTSGLDKYRRSVR